ncbi:DUF6838 family protein [Paenibacillus sp. P22]|uniref:phage tail terminator family protein n=1 Tax=Paenibacillus sp. P22 TaxID=483908 RepID=UPI00038FBC7B|nr:hypothetical protein [Paenibacillus sp. P22]CDN45369.1 hypothetical protein BN871_HH_00110 [Paenibacillus sp. P22]
MTAMKQVAMAVSRSLQAEFPGVPVINGEEPGGGPPAAGAYFQVRLLAGSRQHQLGGRYRQSDTLLVAHRPAVGALAATPADSLYRLLDLVMLPDGTAARGSGISHELVDGMLYAKAAYVSYGGVQQEPGIMMHKLMEEVEPIGPTNEGRKRHA